jgi:hypothetical protein
LERAADAALRLALALGQNRETLEKVERRELHPAMAAFGLWQEEADLANLVDKIAELRQGSTSRPTIDL